MRRTGRFRSASRGLLPGVSVVPISLGVVADQAESLMRDLRVGIDVVVRRVTPNDFAPARAGYPTIVPVPGLFERWEHLLPMLRRLNRIGFGIHPMPEFEHMTARVDDLAEALMSHLVRADLRDVAILAHSKGGLVGKVALLRDGESRIRHLVAISTPFKGSRIAALARKGSEIVTLSPASRQTIKLSRRTEVDHRITSIYATFDEVVAEPTQVALGRNIEAARVGHNTVLSNREVFEHVALELARVFGLPRRLEPDDASLREALEGRKRDIMRDYGFAVGWQLRGLWPDRARRARWRTGSADRATVVLLPGVLERWPFLRAIGDRLARAGHPVHTVPSLGVNCRLVPAQAARVAEYLRAHDLRDVVLVAHSKGGLIGKSVLRDRAVSSRVLGLVAVATPFNGSPYARWFVAPSIREFSPEHPVIVDLARDRAVNDRIVSLWPSFDQHIPVSSRLVGARANVVLPGTGHFRILSSRVFGEAVQRYVAAFEQDALGRSGADLRADADGSAGAVDGAAAGDRASADR